MRNLFVVEDVDPDAFRNKRVLVECFFGRLKKKYGVFGAKWTMSVELFDIFFDCACAMTNVDIMLTPLTHKMAPSTRKSSSGGKRGRLRGDGTGLKRTESTGDAQHLSGLPRQIPSAATSA